MSFTVYQELQSIYYDTKDYEGLPFDFYGGYVGYIGYVYICFLILFFIFDTYEMQKRGKGEAGLHSRPEKLSCQHVFNSIGMKWRNHLCRL